ncbi:hypothetical protein [Methanorbis rubei]|uniref:Uncharacterized protein n=1 Tax=Methanorbis rubei TaxID=3028300 RepID=A0AAE4MEI1_9EURY|nr:hypothetical protein [Methanocorpusculaceae archaeon Cs1]
MITAVVKTTTMRIGLNLQLEEEDIAILDKILQATGFESRTDYVTALLQTTIYGPSAVGQEIPADASTWIKEIREIAQTRDETRQAILDAYDAIAFPVIAMRGGKTALALLRGDIETTVLEKCGVLPAPEDLDFCMKIYQNIRRPKLLQHRTRELAETFRQAKNQGGRP